MSASFTKRTIKLAAFHGAASLLLAYFGPSVYSQDENFLTSIGRKAPASDLRVYRAVEESVRLREPKWRLLEHWDSAPGTAYWQWKHGKRKISLYVSFMASDVDASRRLKYTLNTVEIARYHSMSFGDEGYLDGESGWALFRVKSLVIDVDARKVKGDAIKQFAEQIAVALRAP
jgi:hypothetical protein